MSETISIARVFGPGPLEVTFRTTPRGRRRQAVTNELELLHYLVERIGSWSWAGRPPEPLSLQVLPRDVLFHLADLILRAQRAPDVGVETARTVLWWWRGVENQARLGGLLQRQKSGPPAKADRLRQRLEAIEAILTAGQDPSDASAILRYLLEECPEAATKGGKPISLKTVQDNVRQVDRRLQIAIRSRNRNSDRISQDKSTL
jgi:hypothetical protein